MKSLPLIPTVLALCLAAPLYGSAPAAPRADGAQAPVVVPAPPKVDEAELRYQELATKYAAAEKNYFAQLDEARKQGKTPAESGLVHPIGEYYARFEALAQSGNGHALLWTGLRVEAAHPAAEKSANAKATLAILTQVVERHASAPWFKELTIAISALYIACPASDVDTLVEALVLKCPDRELAAEALYRAGASWKRSKADGAAERAKFFFDRITKDYANSAFGRKHSGEGSPEVGLAIGKLAPDFSAKDADGVEFKLGDYRGKVVVLDFWGFW